jgi:PDZ domain-containing protein
MEDERYPGANAESRSGWMGGPGPSRSKALAVVPFLVLAFVLLSVRLPYFVIGPGPAEDVTPLIHVSGIQTYDSAGHFILTSVTEQQATAYDLVRAWLDRSTIAVPEAQILAPGQTQEQETQIARSQMDTSKIDAAVVALTAYADYPKRHGDGALIEIVFTGEPADGKLFAGDVIVSIDGRPVRTPDDVGPPILASGAGHPVRLVVDGRPNGRTTVTVTPRWEPKVKRPVIGVTTISTFPFDLTIDSGNIGGPSAGLMWTLGIVDLLTPRDLTGGRRIAGTGEIDLSGKVYPIGGVEEKVVAAKNAGATVFLVPVENAAAARSVGGGITIVPVRTYQDAVTYLRTGSTGTTG